MKNLFTALKSGDVREVQKLKLEPAFPHVLNKLDKVIATHKHTLGVFFAISYEVQYMTSLVFVAGRRHCIDMGLIPFCFRAPTSTSTFKTR